MRKCSPIQWILVLVMFCGLGKTLHAQNAIVGGGVTSGWGGGGCPTGNGNFTYLSAGQGTTYIYTGQANGTGTQYWRFGVDWSGTTGQYTISPGSNTAVSPNTTYSLNTSCTTNGALDYNVPSTSYNYVFKTLNAGTSPSGTFVFFEIQGSVQSVSSVSQNPIASNVYPGSAVTVTASLTGSLASGQAVYLRYTSNAWSTSSVVTMTGSGSTYTASIPASANTPSAVTSYYVFTSGTANVATNGSNADLYTINLNNNGGSNYSYTVNSAYITTANGDWNSISTWLAGSLPPANAAVIINNAVTVNGAVTNAPNTLNVNTGESLTFGNSGALTVNTNLTNNGSIVMTTGGFLTMATSSTLANGISTFTGGTGTVVFSGTGTVSGTISFNNVTITGGVNFGTGSTISGTLSINTGGYIVSNPPIYGTGSLLQYNTGATPYVRGLEWSSGTSAGYPYNVEISGNTTIDAAGTTNSSTTLYTANNLTIDAGSALYMDYSSHNMTVPLNINGNLVLVGNLSGSGTIGGDINVKGNWTNNGTANNFFPNGRTTSFIGTSTQIIGGSNTSGFGFSYLTINNTGGVTLSVPITVANTLNLTTGIITTTTVNTLTLTNTAGTAISGGSSSSFVNGPLNWTLPANLSAGTSVYSFPTGSGSIYLPFSITTLTTGGTGI